MRRRVYALLFVLPVAALTFAADPAPPKSPGKPNLPEIKPATVPSLGKNAAPDAMMMEADAGSKKETKPKRPPATPAHQKDGSSKTPAAAAAEADQLLRDEVFAGAKQQPLGKCDDATFLRRVTLDLCGEIPSVSHYQQFIADKSPDKRQQAIERLLKSLDYGSNWSHYWRDVIFARRTEDRALFGAMSCQKYLEEEFNHNTSWDEIARSFMTASGDVKENGDTALMMAQNGNTEDVTSEICRIFMGIQISCANCHNHPTDRWVRDQFHGLAAFFPRVEVRQILGDQITFVVQGIDREPFFRGQQRRATTEHYMPDLKKPTEKGKLMQPTFFVTGQKLSTGVKDSERRATAAKWITAQENEWFAKAYVNRMWSELVGEGFYEPVDDMGPDRQANAAKTMDFLAKEFVAHNHDMKWLFRTMMATDAYQRESRSRREPDGTPFVANVQQRLRSDQLYASLLRAVGIDDPFGDTGLAFRPGTARAPRAQFYGAFNYDPSSRRDEVTGTIPQALMLMNSFQINRYINGRIPGTTLARLLKENSSDESLVNALYVRSLTRPPADSELKRAVEYVKKCSSRTDACEDLLWALVNSTEFLHRR